MHVRVSHVRVYRGGEGGEGTRRVVTGRVTRRLRQRATKKSMSRVLGL